MNHIEESKENILEKLPGLDCGLCGSRTCASFAETLSKKPQEIERCIHLAKESAKPVQSAREYTAPGCRGCEQAIMDMPLDWKDSLGREYDFILDALPGDPGPREVILPHNPARTKELDVQKGDTLIGRPMGMSCGCPITHCGIVMEVDHITGVMSWCVTGPLNPRSTGFKDIGYYSAQAYEGIVSASKTDLKIGMRHYFMPHRCMLQWRHSGLINFINNNKDGMMIRVEGLFIG